jgi:uncharacterized protein YraI
MSKKIALFLFALVFLLPQLSSVQTVQALHSRADIERAWQTTSSSPLVPRNQAGTPCDGTTPERVYLFLDCDDIRRIRQEKRTNRDAIYAMSVLSQGIETYRRAFPTHYYPEGSGVLWWGGGHYVARDLGLLYLITGTQSYATDIARLLEMVVRDTPSRNPSGGPESGLFIHPKHGAAVIQSLVFAYLTIRDTDLLNDEQRQTYDQFFIGQAVLLEEYSPWPETTPPPEINQNVYLSADLAEATLALAFPENPTAQMLYTSAYERLTRRLTFRFDSDGGWYEQTDNYAAGLLEGLLTYAETELKRGNNLYEMDFGDHSIHTICEWFVKVMTPVGLLPAINDGVWGALEPGLLNLCAARTGDPALRYAYVRYVSGVQSSHFPEMRDLLSPFGTLAWADSTLVAAPPAWTSVLMPGTGLAILRSGWGAADQYLLLQFTDTTVHRHFSYGSIVLHDVVPLMIDNGYHLGINYERSISTADHSTLALNDANQTFTHSTATFFAALPRSAMVSVIAEPYPNFSHRRTVLWITPLHRWVVVDDADLAYGSGSDSLQLRWYVKTYDDEHQDGHWTFFDNQRLTLDLLPGLPAEYRARTRTYEYWNSSNASSAEMQVVPSEWPVRLVSVIASRRPADSRVTRTDSADGTLIQGENSDGLAWAWLLPSGFPGSAQVQEMGVTGQAGCVVKQDEALQSYCLMGGTALSDGQRVLVALELPTCQATNRGGSINLRSGPGTGYTIVGTLASQQTVTANGRNEASDWLRIITGNGTTAWVYAPLITLDCTLESLNIAADTSYPSVEVDFSAQEITIYAAQPTSIRLYWPFSVASIINSNGISPDYSLEDETLVVSVPAGQVLLRLMRDE